MGESVNMLDLIKEQFALSGTNPGLYSPLTLAFIGDSVFGMIVKSVAVLEGNCPANELDKKAVRYVKASAQAGMVDYLLEQNLLTQEEEDIVRRGRNAKSSSTAKNASVGDYRKATGLEALVGYLYLSGRCERCIEIIKAGITAVESHN